jgi:hypothetical protein
MQCVHFRHSYTFSECDTACSGSGSGLSGSGSGSGSGGGPTHVEGTSLPIDPLYRPELHDELITGVRLVAPRGGPAAWVAVALALAVAIFFFFLAQCVVKKKKKKKKMIFLKNSKHAIGSHFIYFYVHLKFCVFFFC